jgi:hypothetical protein
MTAARHLRVVDHADPVEENKALRAALVRAENSNRGAHDVTAREMERRRLPDRCEQCGRFVGYYPAGFYCDRHCAACVCRCCPGVDGAGVYTVVGR